MDGCSFFRIGQDMKGIFAVIPCCFDQFIENTCLFFFLCLLIPLADFPQTVSVSAAQTAVSSSQNVSVSQTSVSSVKLQTGLFSRQANAQAQAEGLTQAGFSPSIEQRGEMWVVTVSAGADTNRAIKELKDAGFDSFPLR